MHSQGAGGGFGGMMGGMRGLQSGGMNSPNLDNLTDEGVQGSAYDNKVVMRLATYLKSHQKDVLISILIGYPYPIARCNSVGNRNQQSQHAA